MDTLPSAPRAFARRSGAKCQVVVTDADGITFATFESLPEESDPGDLEHLSTATSHERIRWADVRKVIKSGTRAIHVETGTGGEHFATWNATEIWDEIRARAPELEPGKAAAPSVGRGYWLKMGGVLGAVGATLSGLAFWLGGQAWLWESAEGRVRLGALAIVSLVRVFAWVGPWPWIALTVLALGFVLLALRGEGKNLPQDDTLERT